MYLSIFEMEKLRKAGFNFGEDEHLCYPGTIYFYKNKDYVIGGFGTPVYYFDKNAETDESLNKKWEYTELDKKIAAEGSRLATVSDLLSYIEEKEYSFEIKRSTEDRYYYGEFRGENGHCFSASGPSFIDFLSKSVFKIARYINSSSK